ncbi:MAG: transposase [Burkholderiaceae bacterium]|nr:transposase [Burkholderiaceae bacterium]
MARRTATEPEARPGAWQFGNLRHNKRLNRFTLRGKDKVGTQWRLFCLVHNIEKVANSGKWG